MWIRIGCKCGSGFWIRIGLHTNPDPGGFPLRGSWSTLLFLTTDGHATYGCIHLTWKERKKFISVTKIDVAHLQYKRILNKSHLIKDKYYFCSFPHVQSPSPPPPLPSGWTGEKLAMFSSAICIIVFYIVYGKGL